MEFSDVQTFFAVLIGACVALTAIAGACAVIVKFWQWAHRQSDANANALEEFERYLASDKRRIEHLEKNQDSADEQNKLMMKALVMLMSHELDGNHTKKLAEVRDEIQKYLIDHM